MGKDMKVESKKQAKLAKVSSSDESSDEETPVVTIPSKKGQSAQKGKASLNGKKKVSSDESSSSDSEPKKGKKAPITKGKDTKKAKVSSSESEEEVVTKKPTPAKKPTKKVSSSESEEEVVSKKPTPAKKPTKKVSSSESEEEVAAKKPTPAKKPTKKVSSSESEEGVVAKKPTSAKKPTKKVSSSESEEEVVAKKTTSAKKPAKKHSSSESESEEEVKPPTSKAVVKTTKKQEDTSDSSDEEVLPKKRKSSTSDPAPLKKPAVQEQASDLKRKINETQIAAPAKQFKPNETGETEVFVGGLSYNATEDDLNNLFAPCGEIEALRLLYDKETGSSKGIAFVKFIDQEGLSKALQLNGTQHMGRFLRINLSSDKPSGDRAPRAAQDNTTTIFVGSLSYNSTEDSIRSFFGTCGDIKGVRIALDEEGNIKGFAHVEFFASDAAEKATQLNGADLDGRNIKVDMAGNKSGGGSPAKGRGGFGGAPRFGAPKDNAKQKGSIQQFQGKKMTF